MTALEPLGDMTYRALCNQAIYRLCKNTTDWHSCNWLVPVESDEEYCPSCALNETIPDLQDPDNLTYWYTLEQGKRRLIYSLMRMGLPVEGRKVREDGLAFEFLRNDPSSKVEVKTGHYNGLITVDVAEADDLERERTRLHLNEVYRSVLGHFRHESGHYYWWRLVHDKPALKRFRNLFGDESADYEASVAEYYVSGPRENWQRSFVSAYASSHPWEDWAECWSHYLTIIDALETAQAFGVEISAEHTQPLFTRADSYRARTFDEMLDQWLPLTYAINSINRSGGNQDLYPFILPGPAIAKLRFVHDVVKDYRDEASRRI